ncbi:CPBP family intramembrane glutamic endopeptidase [Paenibacillus thiaminolyticus]|uniref:CPBP family intramembrane glutamic endopeptidase n=1 Tax=Paenibacillus thiaminolyticus TaxID=49283 RepID=UPI0025432888|nr:CPBP family intramembrane glutamic endopeptidase [Paenibacillus thiaminolyticus]WII37493.1 CPBP family intramembrane metalloprotease [Paenibacillus thiaminolyticus]
MISRKGNGEDERAYAGRKAHVRRLGSVGPVLYRLRGFLLRQLTERLPFARANLLVSALFVLIHVPVWLNGGAVWLDMLWRAADMMVFSLIAGCMWKRTGSLWAPALFHTANNLFIQIGL